MLWVAGTAWADADLAQQKNCTACHAADKALYGPAFQAVAARYRGQADALDMLAAKVMRGGTGTWGTAVMPANAVSADEARVLVAWVLSGAPAGSTSAPPSAGISANASALARQPAPSAPVRQSAPTALVQQGRYLVEHVMGCGNCHAGRTPDTQIIPGRELSGGRLYDTPAFLAQPANLTPDVETGLGRWSEADLVKAVTQGVRPSGAPLVTMMPSAFYKALTIEDAKSVAAYLGSVPAVSNKTAAPQYRQAWTPDAFPDADAPYDAAAMARDPLLRGRYLATLAHCLDCHTPIVDGVTDYQRHGGRGGKRFGVARVLAPNITSHTSAGVGGWTDAELRRALFEGKSRDGRTLQYPMPWPYLSGLTSADRDALIAWLRTVPARE